MTSARPITGRAAWHGEDLARATDWIRPITPAEQEELDNALRAVQRRGLAWRGVTRNDFPIPRLARALAEVSDELEEGRGVVLLRRLPIERYTEDELRIVYWGLGLHLGYQNPDGELIGDVRDENRLYGAVREAVPAGEPRSSRNKARSAGPLRFHTDRVDVVTLLCVRPAARDGQSRIASSIAVHNAILERRPDLHALLCAPYYHSRQGEVGGEGKYYAMPIPQAPGRWSWARLLRRVFAIDVLVCPRCAGPRRILDAVTQPHAVQRLLGVLGLAAQPPPRLPVSTHA